MEKLAHQEFIERSKRAQYDAVCTHDTHADGTAAAPDVVLTITKAIYIDQSPDSVSKTFLERGYLALTANQARKLGHSLLDAAADTYRARQTESLKRS
jgi:hypothetical protein